MAIATLKVKKAYQWTQNEWLMAIYWGLMKWNNRSVARASTLFTTLLPVMQSLRQQPEWCPLHERIILLNRFFLVNYLIQIHQSASEAVHCSSSAELLNQNRHSDSTWATSESLSGVSLVYRFFQNILCVSIYESIEVLTDMRMSKYRQYFNV